MAAVKKIAENERFTAINVGKLADIGDYNVTDEKGEIQEPGKVYLQDSLKTIGSQLSYTVIMPGKAVSYFHVHHKNEEVYMVIKGQGEYQVDDVVFPICEGSIVRVGVEASRCYKNTGKDPLIMICYQTEQKPLPPLDECELSETQPKFSK